MARIGDLLAAGADVLLRVLPAEDRRRAADARAHDRRARAAAPVVRLGHLRRRRHRRERTHEVVTGSGRRPRSRRWRTSPASATPGPRSRRSSTVYDAAGIENILALGGDPPTDPADARPSDYTYAIELSTSARAGALLGRRGRPPRGATRARPTVASDRRHLADKLASPTSRITQFFFEADHYMRLVDELTPSASTSR